jgi:DNA-binding FrmR family transcriptional regulator
MQDDRVEDVLRRLRSIEGHVRGVARMFEEGEECPSILRQIIAVHGALDKVSQILMREHLTQCLPNDLNADQRGKLEKALAEVSELVLEAQLG